MSNIEIKVEGLKELQEKLGLAVAQQTIETPLEQGAYFLQAWSQKNRLSGPRPNILGVVTNRLRSSLTVSRSIKRDEYSFFIGTNVEYARKHEFGFQGQEFVRPHTRKIFRNFSFRILKEVFSVNQYGDEVVSYKNTRKKVKARGADIFVSGFSRNINLPARPFLRPAIENQDNINKITESINSAIKKALE